MHTTGPIGFVASPILQTSVFPWHQLHANRPTPIAPHPPNHCIANSLANTKRMLCASLHLLGERLANPMLLPLLVPHLRRRRESVWRTLWVMAWQTAGRMQSECSTTQRTHGVNEQRTRSEGRGESLAKIDREHTLYLTTLPKKWGNKSRIMYHGYGPAGRPVPEHGSWLCNSPCGSHCQP